MQVNGKPYCIVTKIQDDILLLTPKPQSSELPPLINHSLKLKGGVISSILMFEGDIFYDMKKKGVITKESEISHCLSLALMPRTPFKNTDAIAMNRVLCGIHKKLKPTKNEFLASPKKPILQSNTKQYKMKKKKLSDETLSENEDDDDHNSCEEEEEEEEDLEDENEEDEGLENVLEEEDEEEEANTSLRELEEEEEEDEDENVDD